MGAGAARYRAQGRITPRAARVQRADPRAAGAAVGIGAHRHALPAAGVAATGAGQRVTAHAAAIGPDGPSARQPPLDTAQRTHS